MIKAQQLYSKEHWLKQRWGKLRLYAQQSLPSEWSAGSGKRLQFLCDCGRSKVVPFYKISQSCGKCLFQPRAFWLAQRWEKLRLDPAQELPSEWGQQSNRRFKFLCDCGRSTVTTFQNVNGAHTRSCGACNERPQAYWLQQTWGKLRLDPEQKLPLSWGPKVHREFAFLCQCGRKTTCLFTNVNAARTQSCGACSTQSRDYWLRQSWGKLRLSSDQCLPTEWKPWTEQIFSFTCECGNLVSKPFEHIYSGNFKSCASCSWKPREFWLEQRWGKLRLDKNQAFTDSRWGVGSRQRLLFACTCGGNKEAYFSDVHVGKVSSCGCLRPGVTELSPAYNLYEYIKTLAADAVFSLWVKNDRGQRWEYDIYIPSRKIAIEYHGLYWHSEQQLTQNCKKDYRKLRLAEERGDRLIQIYQDEWVERRAVFEELFQSLCDLSSRKLRVSPKFSIELGTPPPARAFLDRHHYLGAAGGCLTVMAKHKGEIVGVWVFMKREQGVVLWHRACWDHRYKAWNPHEKALSAATPELRRMGFHKIVTFADNRFHTGELYEKLGFTLEKELKPDYSYTDGKRRVSKYALRVKAGVDEKSSATARGWCRIWDSGKKRYSLTL